jgi:prepilin-type N-terminal cleavage/methylation domain-containing protein/prepilin-type processing-associated H-X9-DG protein
MRRTTAFTLIELLVVIAIISILAAILFPVFAKVREKARQTACTSNEKQLALGVLMYAQDNDEVLPPVAVKDIAANVILWPVMLEPYTKSAGLRICPSDSGETHNSYGLNEITFADLTDTGAPPSKTLAAFQTPSDTLMLGELGMGSEGNLNDFTTVRHGSYKLTAPDVDLNDTADARPSARHTDRTNIALMDGHVKSLRLEQFYRNQTPPEKWFTP